ncbi:hypothetical protein K402DRAFT_325609, partial [Aulographum hederae CBS 113979]
MSFELLVQFSKFCDKYDCTALVKPWVGGWIHRHIDHLLEPGYENFLWIAWAFGRDDIFENLTWHLAME